MKISTNEFHALLRRDLSAFIERCFYQLNPAEEYLPAWYIDLIAAKLEACRQRRIRRLIINLPPRMLKSIAASIAFPAWLLGHDPSAKVLCASYAQDFSEKLSRDTLTVMSSQWYRELFQTRLARDKQAVQEFATTAQGFRMATSVTGPMTGRGADYIIIDDPLKADDARSEVQRKRVNEWFKSTVYTRLNSRENGVIIIIMQRLHEDDLVGSVLEQEEWEMIKLPALAEEDEEHLIESPYGNQKLLRLAGEPLHPALQSREALEHVRQVIGSYAFAGQYQQVPAPAEDSLVRRDWFKYYKSDDLPDRFDTVVLSWDTANKPDQLANFSVCTTWGVKAKQIYLLHVLRKRLSYPDLKRAVAEQWRSYRGRGRREVVLIEDRASGTQLIQELKYEGLSRVQACEPEGDKIMRMHAQTATIENGFVYLPADAYWLEEYLHELTTFPKSKHTDQVDSTSQALKWIKQRNWGPGMGILEFYRQEVERLRRE